MSLPQKIKKNTLNTHGVHGSTPWRKPKLYKKNTAYLKFAKEHRDIPKHFWENVLWNDETKVRLNFWEERIALGKA